MISAVLVEAMRRNGKRLMSVRQAVEMLRANGKIEAARIDGETGEVIPSVRTAFRPLARHRPHRPVMAHPRRRHEDQTPLYRPTVGLGGRNTPRAAHADRRQHPPFPRHPPTAQTRPPIPTTSASNSPTTPSDDWAMTAAPPANPNTQCTDSATSSPTSA